MSSNCNFDSSKNQACSADTSSVSNCSHGATSAPETSLETIQDTLQLIRLEFAGLSKHLDQLAQTVDGYASEPISLGDKTDLPPSTLTVDALSNIEMRLTHADFDTIFGSLSAHIWNSFVENNFSLLKLYRTLGDANRSKLIGWLNEQITPSPIEATASPMRRCGICGTGNNFAIYPHEDGSETLMCQTCFLDSVTDEGTDEPAAQNQPQSDDPIGQLVVELQTKDGLIYLSMQELFSRLMSELWYSPVGFSGNCPFGYSNWKSGVYEALVQANLVDGVHHESGELDWWNEDKADQLIYEWLDKRFGDIGLTKNDRSLTTENLITGLIEAYNQGGCWFELMNTVVSVYRKSEEGYERASVFSFIENNPLVWLEAELDFDTVLPFKPVHP